MKKSKAIKKGRPQVRIPARVEPLLRQIGKIAAASRLNAYAVGGCVRDWALSLSATTDFDVTVEGDGVAFARAVAKELGGALSAHEQFGTATIRLTRRAGRYTTRPKTLVGKRVDIATCRREIYAHPAAYPKVSTGTLGDDLLRRDFTVNAMAVILSPAARFGVLVDPFKGLRDLRLGQLRTLHSESFLDDPSRILRGVRFAKRFGMQWERKTLQKARHAIAAGALGWLNAGRLQREFERMYEEPDPGACFRHLALLLGEARKPK